MTFIPKIEDNILVNLNLDEIQVETLNPKGILTNQDVSVFAKTNLARQFVFSKSPDTFGVTLYIEVQNAINQFSEPEPLREGVQEFFDNFKKLAENISVEGFLESKSVIVLNREGQPINGAHRLAISLARGIDIPVVRTSINRKYEINFDMLVQRGCSDSSLRTLVWEEYLYLKNLTPLLVFEMSDYVLTRTKQVVKDQFETLWLHSMELDMSQVINLNSEMYQHESWFRENSDPIEYSKSRAASILQSKSKINLWIFVLKDANLGKLQMIKEKLRGEFNLGNFPIHSVNNKDEEYYLMRTIFEPYSHEFTFAKGRVCNKNLATKVQNLSRAMQIPKGEVLCDSVVISGSSILEAWNVREGHDLDVVVTNIYQHLPLEIDDHAAYYRNELAHNSFFEKIRVFTHLGFYWVTLSEWKSVLLTRGDLKSRRDILLINSRIHRNLKSLLFIWKIRIHIRIRRVFIHFWLWAKPFLPSFVRKLVNKIRL